MMYCSSLIIFMVQSLLFLTTLAAIQKATNFEAGNIVLYNSTSISMPTTTYTVTLKNTFASTPTLAFGINNYKLGDRFLYQNFQSAPSVVNTNSFSISVTSISSTNVRLFSISYVVTGISAISSEYQTLTSATNISSGSGDRYLQVYYSKSFTSTNVLALPFITGFYITSSNYFQYIITAQVISNFNYQVRINTTSDCQLLSASFYVLFCQTNKLPEQSYYQGGQDLYSSTDVNSASYTAVVTNYDNADFILGLRGFEGFTALSGCYWGWQIANISNSTANLTIDKNQLQKISFSFFQLGQENTTTTDTGSSQGSSSIGIIIGLIIGIIVVAVGIILFLRYYWRKGVYNIPKNDHFKEMPSLTL